MPAFIVKRWALWRLIWHMRFLGHSVDVDRGVAHYFKNRTKGYLYHCECGLWAAL